MKYKIKPLEFKCDKRRYRPPHIARIRIEHMLRFRFAINKYEDTEEYFCRGFGCFWNADEAIFDGGGVIYKDGFKSLEEAKQYAQNVYESHMKVIMKQHMKDLKKYIEF